MQKYKENIIVDFTDDVDNYFRDRYDIKILQITGGVPPFISYSYNKNKFLIHGYVFSMISKDITHYTWEEKCQNTIKFILEHIDWYIQNYNIDYDDVLFRLDHTYSDIEEDKNMCIICNPMGSRTIYL